MIKRNSEMKKVVAAIRKLSNGSSYSLPVFNSVAVSVFGGPEFNLEYRGANYQVEYNSLGSIVKDSDTVLVDIANLERAVKVVPEHESG